MSPVSLPEPDPKWSPAQCTHCGETTGAKLQDGPLKAGQGEPRMVCANCHAEWPQA